MARRFRGCALSCAAALAMVPALAYAQTQTAADNNEANNEQATNEPVLGEIVVTAQRRSESIQRVPISMQALDTEMLADRQVKSLTDFATLLPSVTYAGTRPGENTPYFRGIVPAGGRYASVGFYLDDIPITGVGVPDVHVYDLERIEALSGPQGTLYGAGSLAGTIRLITNKPKLNVFEAGYDLQGNKYGSGDFGGQIESYVNVPVNDRLAVRVVGYYRHDGGYIDNTPNNGKFNTGRPSILTLGDNDPNTNYVLDNSAVAKDNYNPIYEYGGRVQALWEPADGWTITPMLSAQRQIAHGQAGYDPRVGDLQVHDYDENRQDDKWYQAQLSIHGHIGDWDLVSATGYFNRKTNVSNDYTYYTVTYDNFGPGYENYLQFFDKSGCTGSGATLKCTNLINPAQYAHSFRNQQKFTQEVRLATPKSWPFDVTVGGFFQWQKEEQNNYFGAHGLDQIVGYTQAGGQQSNPAGFGIPTSAGGTMILGSPAVKGDASFLTERDFIFHDEALFAEGHYNITPKLKITGGIRYFWTKSSIVGFGGTAGSARNTATSLYVPTGARGCPVPFPAERLQCLNTNLAAADQVGRYKEQGETHKVALTWQVTPSKMLYANYSTGFRPGGFNKALRIRTVVNGTASQNIVPVDPYESESLANYEIGVKTNWNNILHFNAAIYYQTWDNVEYSVTVAGTQGLGLTGNAGSARVYGIEYDASLKLDKFTISTNGAYNDAKLAENFCNFVLDPSRNTIAQLPSCTPGAFVPNTSPPAQQTAATVGTRLPHQPKFKGTSSIRYDTELGNYRAYIQAAALYQTGATQDLDTINARLLGDTAGFVSFDFSAGIKKDNWHADLFIQNAFDRRGNLTTNAYCVITLCADSARSFPIRPQFYGVKFGQSF